MRAALALSFALLASIAEAAKLEVSPTSVDVVAPAGAGAVTLTNLGEGATRAQVRIFRWRQENGEDALSETDAVVVSPPALVLGSRQPYTIRVIRRGEQPRMEESYRLIVDELPEPSASAPGARVAVAIRLSIPVFFSPSAVAPEALSFQVASGSLVVRNDGGRRVRLSDLVFKPRGGSPTPIAKGLAGYVLPGSSKSISLSRSAALVVSKSNGGSISAMTDRGPIDAPVLARH